TLDADAVALWLRGKQRPETTPISELIHDADLRAEIQRVIDKSNAQVSKAEQIRSFVIVPQEWTQAGGQITPSLKLKRNVVLEQHAADIEAIYAGKRD
ncbi:MAG: long-chain fatty acid--CoA ligase, partial [Actinobacteria bacterium]|nr:long-chain fatty acid--CoA ligase [Actinomycetota bacterium]